jgi:HSP20 family protein
MTTLSPYRSNDVFSELRRDMDDAYASWFGRNRALATQSETLLAPLDVHENEKEFTVRVDAPGLNEKDLKVNCHGDVLTISGERKSEKSETRGTARYAERTFGSFTRSMRLPAHVLHDQIRARYTQGVLEVVVPKAPSAQQREIKVEV